MIKNDFILQMKDISKHFPGVQALSNFNLNLKKGEVLALVGENGAGKSTLMKILLGVYQPDAGDILIKGNKEVVHNPNTALHKGISMIHQELTLISQRSIAENIWIGREPKASIPCFINWKELYNKTEHLLESLELDFNPRKLVRDLSVAGQQMVEIARALSYNAEIIIMDEPTSALTEVEVERLFRIINGLKSVKVSLIYISHKIDEIFELADRAMVLRDGQNVGEQEHGQFDKKNLISMMVGRDITAFFPKKKLPPGDVVFEAKNLRIKGSFENISFKVREREMLGIAGLMGAGRTEIVRAIFGIDKLDSGEIYLNGNAANISHPHQAIQKGIGFIPEDRKKDSLALVRSVKENISITILGEFCRKLFISKSAELNNCQNMIKLLSIRTPHYNQLVNFLSGGNQQKVVLAKWLSTKPRILILDEPTRGIDVGAKAEIHRLMSNLAEEGLAIIMISSELPEILGMSDRIIVIHGGRIKGEFSREDATQEKILECAVGN